MDSDRGDDKGWLRRLPRLLKGKKRGDVIIGRVGEGARGVAVGKNIIQIGTLIIPTLPLLALVLITASGLAFYAVRPSGPKVMTGEFNIAVAQFGQVDEDGEVRPSEDGKHLSQWLFDRLQGEYESLSPEVAVQIWHDSLDLGLKIRVISGRTFEARAETAAALAQTINADIIIYGNLFVDEDRASFAPEFYVAALPGAGEIIGRHELGAPILVQFPIDHLGQRLRLNQKLTSRTKALSLFAIGLAWDFSGYPERALEFFQQAEQVEDWTDSEGREVLYLFIGRGARMLERDDEALEAFSKALSINPDFARAHIGLGNVHFVKAKRLPPAERLEVSDLDQAIAEYRQALDAATNSSDTQLEFKARLALGGSHRVVGEAYLHRGELAAAEPHFDMAIEETLKALGLVGEGQHREFAQAYLRLGNAYHLKAHTRLVRGDQEESKAIFKEAIGAYAQCIEQADAQPFDSFLEDLSIEYCAPNGETVQEALLDLQEGNE